MDEQFKQLQDQLDSLPKPMSGDQPTNIQEVNTQQAGLKTAGYLESLQSKARAEQWYPESTADAQRVGGETVPFLNRVIDTSLAPLYGIVGAVDYATGNSKASSLGEAINYNANTAHRTFGDVTGNGAVGLTADIIFDPVNWITAGTTALVPRTAAGLYKGAAKQGIKGAVKGAAAGAESRLLESMLTAGALTRGAVGVGAKTAAAFNPMRWINKATKKAAVPTIKDAAEANKSNFMKFLEGRSIKAAENFDNIMGTTAIERMVKDNTPVGLVWRKGFQDLAERAAQKSPVLADYFDKYWKYSNTDWTRISQLRDALIKTSGAELDSGLKAYMRSFETGEDFEQALAKIQPIMRKQAESTKPFLPDDPFAAVDELPRKSLEEQQKILSALASEAPDNDNLATLKTFLDDNNQAAKVADDAATYITQDHIETGLRLAAEKELIDMGNMPAVMEDLKTIIKRGDMGESGVKWWDNMRQNLRTFEVKVANANKAGTKETLKNRVGAKVAKTLDVYEAAINIFKRGAVGASPTAWTNAVFGNLVMAKMAGIDIADPKWIKALEESWSIHRNKTGAQMMLEELLDSGDWLPMLKNNPTAWEEATNIPPSALQKLEKAKNLVNRVKQQAMDAGIATKNTTDAEVITMMEDVLDEAYKVMNTSAGDEFLDAYTQAQAKENLKSSYKRTLESIDSTGQVVKTNATDFVSNEFFDSTMANKLFSKLAKDSKKEGAYGARLGNWLFNTLPDAYGQIDYINKTAAVIYASKYGVKEGELRIMARQLGLNAEEVTKTAKDGVQRFKLDPIQAVKLSNEAFLNYAAMPAMVKLLRHLPFVGAPFASFTYGMYTKTGRTALTNPALFNKVNLAMDEASADETPIEKALLKMDRYSYLDDPAMINLPFFGNNMVFLNLANMIPYYSLNMFQPPQRTYEQTLPNNIIQVMDRLPIMQDPTGQVIFDYFLLPHLLGEELPKGSFGQTLYPKDATGLDKAKYAARSLADPYVPGILQPFAGLAAGLAENAGAPDGLVQSLPGYRTRSIGEAVQGNTSVGVQSKEDPTQRTFRNIGAIMGFPIQSPVPYSYLDEEEFIRNNSNN